MALVRAAKTLLLMARRETGFLLHQEVLQTFRCPLAGKKHTVCFFTSEMSNLLQQLLPVDAQLWKGRDVLFLTIVVPNVFPRGFGTNLPVSAINLRFRHSPSGVEA